MNTSYVTDFYETKMIPVPEGSSAVCACFHPTEEKIAAGLVCDAATSAPAGVPVDALTGAPANAPASVPADAAVKSEIAVFDGSAQIIFRKALAGSGRIGSVCFAGSGRVIAAGTDHSVHLVTEDQEVWFEESEADKDEEGYYPVSVYPDDDESIVRVGSFARIWNWKTGEMKIIGRYAGKESAESPPSCVSPDSQVKAESVSGSIRLVDYSGGALIRECKMTDPEPVYTAFSSDGKRLCVVCNQGIHLFVIEYGQQPERVSSGQSDKPKKGFSAFMSLFKRNK